MSGQTMKGVILTGHGGPECLSWREDLPRPSPGPREVLIRVRAAGVNNTDLNLRTGWYSKQEGAAEDATWSGKALSFPRIQGADVCGEVVELGAEVQRALLGLRVLVEPCLREAGGAELATPWYLGSECDGGFAQYMKVAARHAYPVKCGLSDAELASFPCSYSTAENMLTRAAVSAGERVLITGASGGVGSAAVQLALARGARVTALTSPAKAQDLLDLGVERTIDRYADPIAALGANRQDVVLDLVGGPTWQTLPELLTHGGRYAVSGAIAGALVELDLRTLYLKDLSFFGCTVLAPEVFGNLLRRIETGQIRPLLAATYPLKEIGAAQAAFAEKAHTGKIVLEVP